MTTQITSIVNTPSSEVASKSFIASLYATIASLANYIPITNIAYAGIYVADGSTAQSIPTGILNASANKDIDVRLAHDAGGSVNFTTQYANLTVFYLGA